MSRRRMPLIQVVRKHQENQAKPRGSVGQKKASQRGVGRQTAEVPAGSMKKETCGFLRVQVPARLAMLMGGHIGMFRLRAEGMRTSILVACVVSLRSTNAN